MRSSPYLETLLVSPVEEKPEEKGSIEGWVEGAPFTETNSTSPKYWPNQDAHLSLETPPTAPMQMKASETGLEAGPATSAQRKRFKAGHTKLFS